MTYKIVFISAAYQNALNDIEIDYLDNKKIEGWKYLEQSLFDMRFGWSNYFSTHLKELGVGASNIVIGWDLLTIEWSRQNVNNIGSTDNYLLQRIKKLAPDVVFIEDINSISEDYLKSLRSACPSIRLVVAHICAPMTRKSKCKIMYLDFIISCTPGYVRYFKKIGLNAHLMYHGFEPMDSNLISESTNKLQKISFFGSLNPSSRLHFSRIHFLKALVDSQVAIDIYSNNMSKIQLFKSLLRLSPKKALNLPINFLLSKFNPQVNGINYLIEQSKYLVAFNNHIDDAGEFAGNMRLFEASGVGSCLLTDRKSNLGDLFIEDVHLLAYSSKGELVEKAKWLLNHPTQAQMMGDAAMKHTHQVHSYASRATELNEIIVKHL
jgi:hypothetical protein